MEKTKNEIKRFVKTNFDRLKAKKKTINNDIHKLRLFTNDFTKQVLKIESEINKIIDRNNITKESDRKQLIEFSKSEIQKIINLF